MIACSALSIAGLFVVGMLVGAWIADVFPFKDGGKQ
jgi:hypothetical protein